MDWQQLPLDRIYFDATVGVPGTAWPIGTPPVPSNTIADVITMLAARNLHKISVHGALTLGDTMEHVCFFGSEHQDIADQISLNSQDVDGSHLEGLIVTGAQGGAAFLTLIRCTVNALTLFAGRMHYCSFYVSTSSFRDASFIDLIDCESISGVVTITVQAPTRASIKNWRGNLILTAQDGGLCHVRGYKGYLEIDAMTAGTLNIYGDAADIQINADCIGTGIINIYGNARVTDAHGAGTTVNNYTLDTNLAIVDTVVDAIKVSTDKQAGQAPGEGTVTANWNTATGTSGEAGEDLVTIGVAATRYKLHSLLLDVIALTDGAVIDVKLFMKVNGNERKVYDQQFTVPTTAAGETPPPDTLGLWIVNGTVVIHDALRVEVHSDTNENVAIAYTYVLEAM